MLKAHRQQLLHNTSQQVRCGIQPRHTSLARNQQCRAAAAAAQPTAGGIEELDVNQLYKGKQQLQPGSIIGPVKPVRIVGQGRGLQASRSVSPGDTLLVSSPLCWVRWQLGKVEASGQDLLAAPYQLTDDDAEELIQQLETSSSIAAMDAKEAWLQHLDDGSPERQQRLPDMATLASKAAAAAAGQSAGVYHASWSDKMGSSSNEELLGQVLDILDINVISELTDAGVALQTAPTQDPAAGAADGGQSSAAISSQPEQQQAASQHRQMAAASELEAAGASSQLLVGLWPEPAFLNHSCVPNTVLVPGVQDRIMVRAVRAVAKEGQLTRSYLGPLAFAPLQVRQDWLQDRFGFSCSCVRCKEEARLDPNLQQLITDTYEAVTQELSPELERAFATGDDAGVSQVCEQVTLAAEVLDAAFNKLGLKQQTQLWVQVSLFKLYELATVAGALEEGDPDPRMLELLTALAGQGAPGSLLHVQQAAQYLEAVAADEESPFNGALNYAEDLSYQAFKLRYGRQLSRGTFQLQLAAATAAASEEEDDSI